ncbi:MAG: hypothetical protein AAF850_01350 [Pseudomonadota bacterium]
MFADGLITLLHLLVFVYWLGGDIGAFYASTYLTRADVPLERRLFAAKMLNDIDMAPRTAIILAFPTGFSVALAKGWIEAPIVLAATFFVVAFFWLSVVWRLHSQAPSQALGRMDSFIRWTALIALLAYSLGGMIGAVALPLFITLKCAALAVAIGCGLAIRRVASPLGGALASLATGDDATASLAIRSVMSKARPLVIAIWLTLIFAAYLGLVTPT